MSYFKKTAHHVTTAAQIVLLGVAMTVTFAPSGNASPVDGPLDYRILATSATSTMERELNDAGADGYRFSKATGGVSANSGPEVIVAMVKDSADSGVWKYKLLATSKTSTMQKELRQAAADGYEYRDQAVFETAFGGKEVVVIMEFNPARQGRASSYRLLATTKTSTMEKELREAGAQGYVLVGFSIGKTAFGGDEVIAILRKN